MAVFAAATAALSVCAAGRAPVWALFVTGGLSRATMPSLGPMVRSRWSGLLGSALLDAAFSLEGIADELIFITGPVLVMALAAGFTPVAGVLVTAALSVAGVLGLAGQRRSGAPAGYLFAFAAGLAAVAIAVLRRRNLAPSPGPGPGHPDMTACHPVTHNPRAESLPVHGQHAGRLHRRQRGRTPPGMTTRPA